MKGIGGAVRLFRLPRMGPFIEATEQAEVGERHPSGAKAQLSFCGSFGTTEVVPFQNTITNGVCEQVEHG